MQRKRLQLHELDEALEISCAQDVHHFLNMIEGLLNARLSKYMSVHQGVSSGGGNRLHAFIDQQNDVVIIFENRMQALGHIQTADV